MEPNVQRNNKNRNEDHVGDCSSSGTMYRLLVINPNSTQSMTDNIVKVSKRAVYEYVAASHATENDGENRNAIKITLDGKSNKSAPPAIQGPNDGEIAIPGVLNLIQDNMKMYDGFLIACFDDIGLQESRQLISSSSKSNDVKPAVTGIGEAAYLRAASAAAATVTKVAPNANSSSSQSKFGVVTTVAEAVPVIQENIQNLGLSNKCVKVDAAGIPVLDLERDPTNSSQIVSKTIQNLLSEDGSDDDDAVSAIVLGCAGMANIVSQLEQDKENGILPGHVTLIEPISAGIYQLLDEIVKRH